LPDPAEKKWFQDSDEHPGEPRRQNDEFQNFRPTGQKQVKKNNHVNFLGFQFRNVQNRKTGTDLILVSPSKRSEQRFREKVRSLLHHSLPLRMKEQVQRANRFLRGWVGYFRIGDASETFGRLADFVNKRVRHTLQRRKGRRGYGWNRVDSDYIYGKLGLFCNYKVCQL
jgi:hypothetical protein